MGYESTSFWEQYGNYLEEAKPIHQRAVDLLLGLGPLQGGLEFVGTLFDLGCGRFQEANEIIPHKSYVGIDSILEDELNPLDYRKDLVEICNHMTDAGAKTACSLFSIECTADENRNRILYEGMFLRVRSLERILVAGFYYSGKRDQETVHETGGLVSYQTIGDLYEGDRYTETRLLLRNPSKMFGPDVVEVWRLLERKR